MFQWVEVVAAEVEGAAVEILGETRPRQPRRRLWKRRHHQRWIW
jgi:hypothetical protein